MRRVVLVFVLLFLPITAFAALPVGVVDFLPESETCAAFDSPFVPPEGTAVTLIRETEDGQHTLRGWVSGRLPTCRSLEEADIAGPYYSLAVPHERDEERFVGIVVAANTATDSKGRITADLDGKPPRETFGECTSYEGIHFRVWSGAPYAKPFVWEAYFYLPYEVEPTCPDMDEESTPKGDPPK